MKDARPKILVVGASGLVGSCLMERLGHRAMGTRNASDRSDLVRLDITDGAACKELFANTRPDVVIHAAALTHVDRCEREPEFSRAVNLEGTRNVASAAARVGARYLFFSTDYVFGGESGPHAVEEEPVPLNVYGRHKLEAEQVVREIVEDHVVIRACNLYGYDPQGMNFVMAVWKRLRSGEPVRVPADQWGSPTLAEDLSEAVDLLQAGDVTGVIHLAGPDYLDRLELARRVAEAFGLSGGDIEGIETSSLGQDAPRPLRGGLDAGSSCERIGCAFRGVADGLARVAAQAFEDGNQSR